ncbi:MAG: hypothetical protein U0269_15905 [Polyangiales bacterium]
MIARLWRYQLCIVLLFSSLADRSARRRALAASLLCVIALGSGACAEFNDPRGQDGAVGSDASLYEDASALRDSAQPPEGGRVAPTFECSPDGTGELVVQLQLAPAVNDSDLWLAALCGRTIQSAPSDQKPLRVVRVPRGETTVRLGGLGDGYYTVLASALGAPSGQSGAVSLQGGASAVTFVSVGANTAPYWSLDATSAPRADAGLLPARDAGAQDSGATSAPSLEFDVAAAGAGAGRIGLVLSPREAGWQDVSFNLANLCSGSTCPILRVAGLELRVERDGLPAALVSISLGASARGMTILPNETFSTDSRIVSSSAFAAGARVKLTLFGVTAL